MQAILCTAVCSSLDAST